LRFERIVTREAGMKIQEILFPQAGKCTEEELYFRRVEDCGREEGVSNLIQAGAALENRKLVLYDEEARELRLSRGGKVWFDTYFNGFSIEKWRKYTILSELSLRLELSGRVRVTLYSEEEIMHSVVKRVLARQIVQQTEKKEFCFDFPAGNGRGMYSFALEALSEECVFYGGFFASEIAPEKQRDVILGAGICTFCREAFVEKNLRVLREHILENSDCPMYGCLEIFLADNGKTLEIHRLQSEHIHIYPNRNLGGAGGFTRDLIEMKRQGKVTHALLMDDDIVLEPEVIVKTWRILTLLKEEYVDAFLGGAMLRLDRQSIQVESGAVWNGGMLRALKAGLDMKRLSCCLYNEQEEYVEYNAWWYCAFPMSVVREDNLPLPVFIRGDDVEYGLRNGKTWILMNGICVWHEPFEYKYSSPLEYYVIRNRLIDNAFHCVWYGPKQLNRALFRYCLQEIVFYRYQNVYLYLRGVEDFLKGPGWLMEQDGEALHRQIMASGYQPVELEDLDMPFQCEVLDQNIRLQNTIQRQNKRTQILKGLLGPARGDTIVPMGAVRSAMFYRRKRVMYYDVISKKAFVTKKSNKEALRCLFKTLRMTGKISRQLSGAQRAYREEGQKLKRLEFWEKYLKMD